MELVCLSRDWREYNSELFQRGEFYFTPNFLDSLFDDLDEINEGRVGRFYEFLESFVRVAVFWYEFLHLPYRQLERVLSKLSDFFSELESADYTTLWHRIRGLELEVLEKEGEMVFAVDATGIKVMNRGEWIRKYHDQERRG